MFDDDEKTIVRCSGLVMGLGGGIVAVGGPDGEQIGVQGLVVRGLMMRVEFLLMRLV